MTNALKKVDSSMVYAVGYDTATKTLEAVFRRGGIWLYHDVPKAEYQRMMKSDSIGSYLRSCIIGAFRQTEIR
jgi:hypothetical protein